MVGGLGALLVVGLTGCGDSSNNNQSQTQNQTDSTFTDASQKQGAFVVVEESADGKYKITDEFLLQKLQ